LATPLGLTPLTRRLTPLGLTPLGLTPLGLTPLGLTPLRWRADAPHRRPRLTPVAWPGADAPRPKLLRVFWHVGHFQSLPSTLTGCRWPLMFLRSWSSLLLLALPGFLNHLLSRRLSYGGVGRTPPSGNHGKAFSAAFDFCRQRKLKAALNAFP